MAVLKNTVQVNNGNTGWNAGHVMDALEEVFADLGWNSGTQKNGVPQSVRSPDNSVVEPYSNYGLGADSNFQFASPAVPMRSKQNVHYDIRANGTTAYRLLKKSFISNADVDATNNQFTDINHGFSTGDPVVWGYTTYYPSDSLSGIAELTFGTTYYVIKVDNNRFKLAASASDATAETAISISAKTGSSEIPIVQEFSSVADNNDIEILTGDTVYWYNRTPGVPTSIGETQTFGTGYAATGTNVPTTGGSGTGLTVDFTAFGGIIETYTINTAGTGYIQGDQITITTGNSDCVFRVLTVSGSLGQKFTLCLDTDDYDANKLFNDANYYEFSSGGYEDYPKDFSDNILDPPTLADNGIKLDTAYHRQTELNSFMPTELRFPDWNATDPRENSTQKYIYANNTTPGMTGNITLLPSVFLGTSGEHYCYFDYTVPADGARGALDLRFVRTRSNTPWGGNGDLHGVYIMNVAEGWTTSQTFTVPGDQIGGSSPTHDVTFGVRAGESVSGARDAVLEIRTTNLGAGTNFFQKKSDNASFGTLRLEHDAAKTYGTTYFTFGIHTDADPHTMWISSGNFMHWLNRHGTQGGASNGTDYGYHVGRNGLDVQSGYSTPNNSSNEWSRLDFATSTTPTAYPLKIYSYRAQSPQDSNFVIIQFVQTINEVDYQYGTFYIPKGPQVGANIWDLDYCWQGTWGQWTSSGRTLSNKLKAVNTTNQNAGSDDEPVDTDSLAREAFYGFRRDASSYHAYDWVDQYGCNIDTDNDEEKDAVAYFRDATYDQFGGHSVSSQADYYRPMKGIPLSRKMMPTPYTLPDDFVLLQVSTSPGLTNFRPGDTITISASEVYEVIRSAYQVNQNGLDGLDNSSSMGILLLARTT